MRISTAYFAGVGTVIAAVAAGLGGGYLAANIAHPPTQAVSKLERRMSAEPIHVSTAPAEPVAHVAATNPASAPPGSSRKRSHSRTTEAAAPSANAAPSTNMCARRREDRQQCSGGATRTAAAATCKIRRTGRRKNRCASGRFCESPRRRHQTRGRRKAPRRAAPALGRQAPLPATARAGARGGRGESPGSDRAAADQNPGRSRAEGHVRRAGENRNAADQAVRSGQLISFRRSRYLGA